MAAAAAAAAAAAHVRTGSALSGFSVSGLSTASLAAVADRGTPIRFHFANGDKIVLSCEASLTFAAVKDKIWAKKKIPEEKKTFIFRLTDGEVFFRDQDLVQRFLHVVAVFKEEEKKKDILDMMLLPEADIGDKENRRVARPLGGKLPILAGWLLKEGGSKGIVSNWKRRFFVFHDLTLYYFADQQTYLNGGTSIAWIPMGACDVVLRPDLKYKDSSLCFQLKAESVGKRDFVLCAEEQADLDKWCSTVWAFNFRRVKSITVAVCEELITRGLGSQEGLFRVSGNKDTVNKIKSDYNTAEYPNLAECKDDHALSGVMKLSIREMHEPLLSFELYTEFVALSRLGGAERLTATRAVVARLPHSNIAFLRYLCQFIKKVSSHSETNMMTTQNLAIVFAPNILRPKTESVSMSISDNAQILNTVQYLIDEADGIWPEALTPSTPQAPKAPGAPSGAGAGAGAGAAAGASPATPRGEIKRMGGSMQLPGMSPGGLASPGVRGSGAFAPGTPTAAGTTVPGTPRSSGVTGARPPSTPPPATTPTSAVRPPGPPAGAPPPGPPPSSDPSRPSLSAPLVVPPIKFTDHKPLVAELADLKKQYEDEWSAWEAESGRRKAAVIAAFVELTAELNKGLTSDPALVSALARDMVGGSGGAEMKEWRERGLKNLSDGARVLSELTAGVADGRGKAQSDAKSQAEEKRKKEVDEHKRKEAAAIAAKIEEKKRASTSTTPQGAPSTAAATPTAGAVAAAAAAEAKKPGPPPGPPTTPPVLPHGGPPATRPPALPSSSPPPLPRVAPPPLPGSPAAAAGTRVSVSTGATVSVPVASAAVSATITPIPEDDDPPPPPPDADDPVLPPAPIETGESSAAAAAALASPSSDGADDEWGDVGARILGVCVVQFAFDGGMREGDIRLAAGERVSVTRFADEQGWWRGKNAAGLFGFFPAGYVKLET